MSHARTFDIRTLVLVLACAGAAHAGVVVEYKAAAGNAWVVQGQNPTPVPGAVWNVGLDSCLAGYWRVRVIDPASESIGLIRFTNSAAAITLIVGSAQDNDLNPAARFVGPACLDWTEGLDPGNCPITLQARVGHDVGPLASIIAKSVVRLDVDGSIHQSRIRHLSQTETLVAVTAGGSIDDNLDDPASPAIIRSEGGPIALVRAGGIIMCPISVEPLAPSAAAPLAGAIGIVLSTAGDVGGARPSTSPADNYHATPISARTIDSVVANNIRNEITATEGVRRVESLVGGLRGLLTAPTLLPIDAATGGLVRAAGVNAFKITLANGLPKNASIVSGYFYGYLNISDANQPRITLGGTDKLAGQIILNSTNSPRPMVYGTTPVPRALMGAVVITGSSSATITQDIYPPASTPIGGGAVGVAKFQLYEQDCTPPNNQVGRHDGIPETAFADPNAVPVVIRSYGPVVLPAGVADPNAAFAIQRQDPFSSCVWINANQMFNIRLHPITPGTNEMRAIGLSAGSQHPVPAIYRVIPTSLVCSSVTSLPLVLWPDSCTGLAAAAHAYTFRVAPDCDGNGVNDYIQIDDLPNTQYLMSGDGSTPPPPPPTPPSCITVCLLDVNFDHLITVQDIFDFLGFWFAGNPRADWNHSGSLNIQDIFDFLNDWFNAGSVSC